MSTMYVALRPVASLHNEDKCANGVSTKFKHKINVDARTYSLSFVRAIVSRVLNYNTISSTSHVTA